MQSVESSSQTASIDFAAKSSEPAAKWDINQIRWTTYLVKTLQNLSEKNSEHDAVLSVEGKLFYVRKELLSIWSPFFKSLFSGNFKKEDGPYVINWNWNMVELLLVMIYMQCDIEHVDGLKVNVFRLAEAADYFNVVSVIVKCKEYIIANFATLDIYDLLRVTFVLNWEAMKTQLLKHFKSGATTLAITSDNLATLPMDCKDFLLKALLDGAPPPRRVFVKNSENTARPKAVFQKSKEHNRDLMEDFRVERKVFQRDFRAEVAPESFSSVMEQVMHPKFSQALMDELKNDDKLGELVLSVMSPIQSKVDMISFEYLTLFAQTYQIEPLMLKCLDYVDKFLEDKTSGNLFKMTEIATKLDHKRTKEQLQDKIRNQFPAEGPMKWMIDNQQEIANLNNECKAFLLDCALVPEIPIPQPDV